MRKKKKITSDTYLRAHWSALTKVPVIRIIEFSPHLAWKLIPHCCFRKEGNFIWEARTDFVITVYINQGLFAKCSPNSGRLSEKCHLLKYYNKVKILEFCMLQHSCKSTCFGLLIQHEQFSPHSDQLRAGKMTQESVGKTGLKTCTY